MAEMILDQFTKEVVISNIMKMVSSLNDASAKSSDPARIATADYNEASENYLIMVKSINFGRSCLDQIEKSWPKGYQFIMIARKWLDVELALSENALEWKKLTTSPNFNINKGSHKKKWNAYLKENRELGDLQGVAISAANETLKYLVDIDLIELINEDGKRFED